MVSHSLAKKDWELLLNTDWLVETISLQHF